MNTTTNPRTLVQVASELRSKYPTAAASTRIRWAREAAERLAQWGEIEFDSNGCARIERDGFSVSVQYTYDEYPDLSWIGEYTDDWQEGAIKHLPGWSQGYDGSEYTHPDPRTYGWFIPAASAEEARRWYTSAGYSRHDAWVAGQRQARQDYERRDHITLYDLKVTVFRAGAELATEYLGGIDLGDDLDNVDVDEQRVIMAIDAVECAIGEAKAAMKRIAIEFVGDATID